jgi:hypothetical protein
MIGSAIIGMFALAGTAFAATTVTAHRGGNFARPAVVGTVSAINGNTLTVASKGFGQNATPTSYTVDATNATVTKNNAASEVSAIAIGDTVMVQGTTSGNNVTAKTIRDGVSQGQKSQAPAITGNGEPVVGGNVTAISSDGTTLTITNKSAVTYTIDATNATISKTGVTGATISNIAVGDNVVVQGTVNGTSVVASSVIDQGAPQASNTNTSGGIKNFVGNFAGAIGGFFTRLFGFF